VVFLVMFFKSSDNLAAAYGIAVASTMLLTTLLMYFITHNLWHWKPIATLAVIVPLALVDAVFVSSNVSKVVDGGWFPLLAGAVLFTIMTTWHRGKQLVVARMRADNLPLEDVIHSICRGGHPLTRVDGTAVFPGGVAGTTPTAFMHNLKHNRVLHRTNIFLAGTTDNVPYVHDSERAVVNDLGDGCYSVSVRSGFMQVPDVPALLQLIEPQVTGWHYEASDTSFFLARDTILASGHDKTMALWREKLFAFLGRNAAQAAEYYSLPPNRVVELGSQINL
jgi:KUP system potassium uptake protein